MSKKKIVLIAIPCILAGIIARDCYVSGRPSKMGTITIPEKQMSISLFCKSRPRAGFIAPYEGEYRIIEVAEGGKPTRFYDLPDTIPADTCDFRVFWYPTNNLIRFHDSGLSWAAQFRSECLLDLEKQVLFALVRERDRVYLAKLSLPMDTLSFPKPNEKSRVSGSFGNWYSGSGEVGINIGEEVAKPIDAPWTKEAGVLVGEIAPGRETKGDLKRP